MVKCWVCEEEFKDGERAIVYEYKEVYFIMDDPETSVRQHPKTVHIGECAQKAVTLLGQYWRNIK